MSLPQPLKYIDIKELSADIRRNINTSVCYRHIVTHGHTKSGIRYSFRIYTLRNGRQDTLYSSEADYLCYDDAWDVAGKLIEDCEKQQTDNTIN